MGCGWRNNLRALQGRDVIAEAEGLGYGVGLMIEALKGRNTISDRAVIVSRPFRALGFRLPP